MGSLIDNLALGFSVALSWQGIFFVVVGVTLGTLVGVLPGIGSTATISLLLPLTFYVEPTMAIIMLAGIYYGGAYGGSTTSILLNVPGSASAAVTCLDGHPMARQGRAGVALFVPAMPVLAAHQMRQIVGRLGEGGFGAGVQRQLVPLEPQHVMGPSLADHRGGVGTAVKRIGRDGAAFRAQALEKSPDGGSLAAVTSPGLGQREAGEAVEDAHHQGRHVALARFVGTPQRLAVHGQHRTGAQGLPHGGEAGCKGFFQFTRVEQAQDPREGVMAGWAMAQLQHLAKLVLVTGGKVRDADAGLLAAQQPAEHQEQHLAQVVARREVARVTNLAKDRQDLIDHERIPLFGGSDQSRSDSQSQSPIYSYAITLPRRGGRDWIGAVLLQYPASAQSPGGKPTAMREAPFAE